MAIRTGHRPNTNYRYVDASGETHDEIAGTLNILKSDGGDVKVDGVSIADALEDLSGQLAGATIGAPTAESSDARTVSIQLENAAGAAIAYRAVVDVVLSSDATADAPGDGDTTIVLTAATDGALVAADESKATFVSEADGDLDVTLTDSADATDSVWLHVVIPQSGKVIASAEIAFVDDTP